MSHPLLTRLASDDPDERRRACLAATADPAAVLFLDALSEALADPVRGVAQAASDSLATLGRSHDAGPALRAALRADSVGRRAWGALTWARLEPPDLRLVPALVAGLGSPDSKLRWAAARVLVETGRLHPEILALLIGLSRADERPVARRMARFCLRELGPDDPAVAEVLLQGTFDTDVRARRAAYTALVALLDPAPAVIEQLVRALSEEPDAASRRIASAALAAIGVRDPARIPPAAIAALRAASTDADDPHLRRGAAHALSRLDPARQATRSGARSEP